jgi:hypothetical protein
MLWFKRSKLSKNEVVIPHEEECIIIRIIRNDKA